MTKLPRHRWRTSHQGTDISRTPSSEGADTATKLSGSAGTAFVCQTTEPVQLSTGQGIVHLMRALFVYAPYKTGLTLILMLITGVLEMFGMVLVIPFLYLATSLGQHESINPYVALITQFTAALNLELTMLLLLGMFLTLFSLRATGIWLRTVLICRICHEFTRQLIEKLCTACAMAKWQFLIGYRHSELQQVFTGADRINKNVNMLIQSIVLVIMILMKLMLAIFISPLTLILIVLTSITLLACRYWFVQDIFILGTRYVATARASQSALLHFLLGLKLAKSHSLEKPHIRQCTDAMQNLRQNQIKSVSVKSVTRFAVEMIAAGMVTVLAWLCLSTDILTLPELVIMILIFTRMVPEILRLQDSAQELIATLPTYLYAHAFQQKLQQGRNIPVVDNEATPIDLHDTLTIRNVSFVYETAKNKKPALSNIDLDIPARNITAITGRSGSGKTTLVDILLGMLEPNDGSMLVDGVPLTEANTCHWRRSVTYVPQEIYLYEDTIRTNLLWAKPDATDAEIWEALRIASADKFVADLPSGLETIAGGRSSQLSGGERQRITLARALLKNPALFILDEATSQLDSENEQHILAALRTLRAHTTIVIVSHHLNVLKQADRIILLDAGRVTAAGTWLELASEFTMYQDTFTDDNDNTEMGMLDDHG